ncbi:MAG: 23S rRNA (pseudouridine(1915)-N(3))-methyltransferase RlmH [Armatimonadaceae bacterium]
MARYQVQIIAVGKLRETYWKAAEAEYLKRLTGYTSRIEVTEVADEPTPDNASAAEEDLIREREGQRLLAKIGERDYVVALDRQGKSLGSETFAAHLDTRATEGYSIFTFVIGGSLGLSPSVLSRAHLTLSFGAFTYPHQLMRVLLLEQLFRAAKIQRGEAYHK